MEEVREVKVEVEVADKKRKSNAALEHGKDGSHLEAAEVDRLRGAGHGGENATTLAGCGQHARGLQCRPQHVLAASDSSCSPDTARWESGTVISGGSKLPAARGFFPDQEATGMKGHGQLERLLRFWLPHARAECSGQWPEGCGSPGLDVGRGAERCFLRGLNQVQSLQSTDIR